MISTWPKTNKQTNLKEIEPQQHKTKAQNYIESDMDIM